MNDKLKKLHAIDWNFSDYTSLTTPGDMGVLHWYPGVFVPLIPSILINALSNEGDLVFDPFVGSGVTALEAIKLNRQVTGVDINPYSIRIARAKLIALAQRDLQWLVDEALALKKLPSPKVNGKQANVHPHAEKWFDPKTLVELLLIYDSINRNVFDEKNLLRQVIFCSILNRVCSQRDHYTYITDNCYPKDFIYRPALDLYLSQCIEVMTTVNILKLQYLAMYGKALEIIESSCIKHADSRALSCMKSHSVDLIVTSPPYLGVNDYVRSMKLSTLFYPEIGYENVEQEEIGARWKRRKVMAYDEYIDNMTQCYSEMVRIIKPGTFLCVIIGESTGRVNKGPVIDTLNKFLISTFNCKLIFEKHRKIKFRRIQVPGIGSERILVFQTPKIVGEI